jgi:hypothetical protein
MSEAMEYGLPNLRDDETGDLKPVTHTFTFDGDEVTIKFIPPTLAVTEEYAELGDRLDDETTAKMLSDILIEPDLAPDEFTQRELIAYPQGLKEWNLGRDLSEALTEALESRGGGSGNSDPSKNGQDS